MQQLKTFFFRWPISLEDFGDVHTCCQEQTTLLLVLPRTDYSTTRFLPRWPAAVSINLEQSSKGKKKSMQRIIWLKLRWNLMHSFIQPSSCLKYFSDDVQSQRITRCPLHYFRLVVVQRLASCFYKPEKEYVRGQNQDYVFCQY